MSANLASGHVSLAQGHTPSCLTQQLTDPLQTELVLNEKKKKQNAGTKDRESQFLAEGTVDNVPTHRKV